MDTHGEMGKVIMYVAVGIDRWTISRGMICRMIIYHPDRDGLLSQEIVLVFRQMARARVREVGRVARARASIPPNQAFIGNQWTAEASLFPLPPPFFPATLRTLSQFPSDPSPYTPPQYHRIPSPNPIHSPLPPPPLPSLLSLPLSSPK